MTSPVVDLFGGNDTTSAGTPADGFSLSRTQATHVVIDDWGVDTPTPRAPNDGGVWVPPDAGPLPDTAPIVDAGPSLTQPSVATLSLRPMPDPTRGTHATSTSTR